ncbi:hypothetical protein CEXT_1091 [Caerostris extrusa]|uniref:Uncharacterized protein n=1 Tax=Caerostris extrusa TaxID=172846 RepID=A0AAV4MX64_CAEEX|nr:hypothetical protein CEXT_1091 [Caerostris extrusa]
MLKKVLEYSSVEFMKATVNEFWREQFTTVPPEELQMLNPVVKKFANLMEEAKKEGHVPLGGFIRKDLHTTRWSRSAYHQMVQICIPPDGPDLSPVVKS